MIDVTMRFYNGDTVHKVMTTTPPPDRLEYSERPSEPVTRIFWLDLKLWLQGTAEYREVAIVRDEAGHVR